MVASDYLLQFCTVFLWFVKYNWFFIAIDNIVKNTSLFTVKAVIGVLLNLLLNFEKFSFFTVTN